MAEQAPSRARLLVSGALLLIPSLIYVIGFMLVMAFAAVRVISIFPPTVMLSDLAPGLLLLFVLTSNFLAASAAALYLGLRNLMDAVKPPMPEPSSEAKPN